MSAGRRAAASAAAAGGAECRTGRGRAPRWFLALLAAALAPGAPAMAIDGCVALDAWRDTGVAGAPRWNLGRAAEARISDEGDRVFDASLVSPVFTVPRGGLELRWEQRRQFSWASSAGVLEIAVDGGPWRDFTAAGGRFLAGGYDSHAFAGNPLGARAAWGGDAADGETRAALPAAAGGHQAQLRFRLGSSGTGDTRAGWQLSGFRCSAP